MPTPPLKIQFSVLKSTYAHWVTDCEYCPWTKPQPSRPAGSYANGEEQWSAFTVGLIYELDLLRLFIEWVTAYATSSCVNSCVQGEGKKKKKERQRTQTLAPLCTCKFSIWKYSMKLVPLAVLYPEEKRPEWELQWRGKPSPRASSAQLGTALFHVAAQPREMLQVPALHPLFSAASQGAGTQREELERCAQKQSEIAAELKNSREK